MNNKKEEKEVEDLGGENNKGDVIQSHFHEQVLTYADHDYELILFDTILQILSHF